MINSTVRPTLEPLSTPAPDCPGCGAERFEHGGELFCADCDGFEPSAVIVSARIPACAAPEARCRQDCCSHEECITRRVSKRQAALEKLGRDPGAVKLAGLIRDAERIAGELREWLGEHSPSHRCPLCDYLRANGETWNGVGHWFEDLLVLRVNMEVGTGVLMNSLPGVITYEMIRDEYEGADDE